MLRFWHRVERQRGTGEEAEAALLMREADRRAESVDQRTENAPEGSEERTQAREEVQ